jgi:diaminopimelate epimerase
MKKIEFVKMNGLGNDFILLDSMLGRTPASGWSERSKTLCDRSRGIGADGLILMLPSKKADIRMRIFNSDGSEAEMCGNGLRCLVRLAIDKGYAKGKACTVETTGRVLSAKIISTRRSDFRVSYCLGLPEFKARRVPIKTKQEYFINGKINVLGKNYVATCLSIGNPHTIIFVDDLSFDWRHLGAAVEVSPIFPNRTNVEFVRVESRRRVSLKSWERGAGSTHASGTGAAASVAAGVMVGLLDRRAEVKCDYGSLLVEWSTDGELYQEGPAEYSFHGSI